MRLSVGLQVMVATLLLAIGRESATLPIVTLVVLGVSAYVTDLRRWFYLNQSMADLLALGVVVVSVIGALQVDRQGLLVSVANLQSYLQYVVLFQPKTSRVYWQLALLSLGQVAIASTLVPGPAFGFMLVAYLLVATFGFAVLLLHVESTRRSRPAASRTQEPADLAVGKLRRPILSGDAVPIDSRTVARGLLGPVALIGFITVVTSTLLFFTLPRWKVANFEGSSSAPLRTVGFSDTVLLGELGGVVDNPDLVMRIQFFRGRGQTAIQLENQPLLRGTVVTRYENRQWSRSFRSNPVMLPTEAKGTIVRQRIKAEPLDVSELFCVFPVFSLESPADSRLRINATSDQLIRLEDYRAQAMEFEVGTTGITGNRQRELMPCEFRVGRSEMERLAEPPPENQFAGLRELAASIVAELNIDPEQDRVAAARALSEYFHRPGGFVYSLDAQARDKELDPLEDFVTRHRAGHCEYFAGALVLMLRSLDIPARMAIGFKGGEWNPLGKYYQVQQLHAHAWVEVFLQRDQIPANALARETAPHGAWLILDPTEGAREGNTGLRNTGLLARLRQSADYAQVLWINYFASLDPMRQRQVFYEPVAAGVEAAFENLTSQQVWQERFDSLQESRAGKFWRWYRRHWFSWRGGLVAIGFSFFAVGAFFSVRTMAPALLDRGWFGKRQHNKRAPVLEIYRRLEVALRRAGLVRQPAQTAREFALTAGGELAERVEYRRVAHLPRRIVDSFYRVRFGGRALDSREAQAVEQALKELERTLARVFRR